MRSCEFALHAVLGLKSMITHKIRLLAIGAALVAPQQAVAFSGYKCTIQHSLNLGQDGSTQPHPAAQSYLKKEFIVDRASGRMLGDISSNLLWKHEVRDLGSDKDSYKSIYTTQPPYVHVRILQILEFQDGPVKPFLLIENTAMHTGTCAHLQ
jgi:hypothetical protein